MVAGRDRRPVLSSTLAGGTEVGRQAVMRWENGELARKMVNIGKNGEHWKNCVKTRSVWSDQGLIDPDSVR